MIRLHQTRGKKTGRSLEFESGPIRLGRMPGCEVTFDAHADLDVSGHHAEVRPEGQGWVVVDVGSRNGTFVNGVRIDRQVLQHGDAIEFGQGGPVLRVEFLPSPAHHDAPTGAASPIHPALGDAPSAPQTRWDTRDGPGRRTPLDPPPPPGAFGAAASAWAPASAGAMQPPWSSSGGHAGVAPQPEPGTPKGYGEKTVGLMLRDAVQEAKKKSERVPTSWKVMVGCLCALLFVATIGIAYAAARHSRAQVPDAVRIATENRPAIARLIAPVGGQTQTICTAFAVRRDTLATTAGCVLEVERRQAAGVFVSAEVDGAVTTIVRMYRHPEFQPATAGGPDFGLVQIASDAASSVTLAAPAAALDLERHSVLVAYGHTSAGLVATPIEVQGGDSEALEYRSVLPLGAPLFDANGAVVGVHVAASASAPESAGRGLRIGPLTALLAGLTP